MVDDSGLFIDGTPIDKAFIDAAYDQIDDQNHSLTNPTIKPKATTDEMVAARGTAASLAARLTISLNDDGTFKTPAGVVSTVQLQTTRLVNYLPDSQFDLWPSGDAAAPYNWVLSGAGAAVARAGSGGSGYEASAPADSTQLNGAKFCAKLTYGAVAAKLTRTLLATMPTALKSRAVAVGVYCKASVANAASIVIDDGVATTRGGQTGNGTFHSGDGQVRWLYATHTISASATKLDIYLENAQSGSAYFTMGVVAFSAVALTEWFPERWAWLPIEYAQGGNLAAGTILGARRTPFPLPQGGLWDRVTIRVGTAPTTQAAIWDFNKNGSSIYDDGAGRPQVAAAASTGTDARPDGTYARRCFAQDDYLTLDCDQVGSGTVGADASIVGRFRVPIDEFASQFNF